MRQQLALARVRARKLARTLSSPRYRAALGRGVLPATDHSDARLREDIATVLDVGASRGQFAVFARETWPTASLICFEPIEEAARLIVEVVEGPVAVHCVALGSESGSCRLHLSGRDDSSSLLPIGRQATAFPGTAATGARDVEVDVLARYVDDSTPRPVLLKIDVQGYELEVLRGAGEELDHVDEILCECSFVELYTGQALAAEVIAHLAARGFVLANVSGIVTSAEGQQLQADLTFRRQTSD